MDYTKKGENNIPKSIRIICEMGILRIACTIMPPHTKIRLILALPNARADKSKEPEL